MFQPVAPVPATLYSLLVRVLCRRCGITCALVTNVENHLNLEAQCVISKITAFYE